jgi:hypothetical protein
VDQSWESSYYKEPFKFLPDQYLLSAFAVQPLESPSNLPNHQPAITTALGLGDIATTGDGISYLILLVQLS